MKKILCLAAASLLAAGVSFGQEGKFRCTLFGGLHYQMAYGSVDDYALGLNDFPVTPAHSPFSFGAALLYRLGERLGLELRGESIASSNLSLSDPWDGDTVDIPSAKHWAASLNLRWELASGRTRPYLVLGGGADKMTGGTINAVSAYGYQVSLAPPDRTLNLFANAGAGLRVLLSNAISLEGDVRYRFLFGTTDPLHSLIATAGIVWTF